MLRDHYKQPHHMRYLPYFRAFLNCFLHHRWKNRSVLLAAVKAALKLVKFADHVKKKKQTFDDLSSEGLLSIILAAFEEGERQHAVQCLSVLRDYSHTVLLHSHCGTFEFQSFLFPRKVSVVTFTKKKKKSCERYRIFFFFSIHSIESTETMFVNANLDRIPSHMVL